MKHIKHYFKTHPDAKSVHETSNGFLFHRSTDADAHAVTLKNRVVKEHKREDHEEESESQIEQIDGLRRKGTEDADGENADGNNGEGQDKGNENTTIISNDGLTPHTHPIADPKDPNIPIIEAAAKKAAAKKTTTQKSTK